MRHKEAKWMYRPHIGVRGRSCSNNGRNGWNTCFALWPSCWRHSRRSLGAPCFRTSIQQHYRVSEIECKKIGCFEASKKPMCVFFVTTCRSLTRL